MGKTVRFLLLAGILVLGAAFFACSSSDDDNDDGSNEPDATEMTDEGEPTADTGDSNNNDDSMDVSDELMALAEEFGITNVKVDYEMSSTGSGENFDGTMTLYTMPPDSWRMDLNTPDGSIAIINSGGTSYMCAEDAGTGQCFESPVGQTIPVPFLSIFTDPDAFQTEIDTAFANVDVTESNREIAGVDAKCFSASGEVEGETGTGEYCFSDSGVLLYLRASGSGFEDGGEFVLTATSVGESAPGDFEPIYDILDLGEFTP